MTEQRLREVIPYPTGVVRFIMRLPIQAHRLGLGSLLGLTRILILTTRGHKTGLPRHTALEYRRHGSKIYVVSAWAQRPHWYVNLLANPTATVQMGRQTFSTRAQPVTDPAEAARVLYMFHRTAPVIYDAILARMSSADTIDIKTLANISKEFTIMRLDIVPEPPALPAVAADRRWVWPMALLSGVVLTVLIVLARSRRD